MRIALFPDFAGEDKGDGGIRRVWEAQRRCLPRLRDQFVDDAGDADVIAAHINFPPAIVRRFGGDKPFVLHVHGLYWSEYEWEPWAYHANKTVLQSICVADAVTVPSEWVAQIVRRHTSRRVEVVPHGVSLQEFRPAEHRGYVLWNKTRVDPVCTPDDLNVLAHYMSDTPFVSTFGDPLPNMTLVGRLGYEEGKELVRHAGVYLCTSRETFGIGTLEAMAAGVPVVGYRFGGQAEIVEHMVDGFLVDPGDIRGLAAGIEWALENRTAVGEAAHKKAARFSWTDAAARYHDIYRSVMDSYERYDASPRTTIIVPAHNLERYLPDTIASVAAQEDKSWECIIVDDASPDGCGAIADAAAASDPRFRVIHNETNLYLAESRNVAIREARGRYILPLDADDMLAPHAVGLLADALDSDRTLQCAYAGVLFVDEDGITPTNYRVVGLSPGHSGWPMPMDGFKQISGANLLPYSSMFRKTAWEQVGGYRRRLHTAEDADFWTRLVSYGFRCDQVSTADTLIYRNREGSMSRANEGKRYDYLRWFPWASDPKMAPAGLAGEEAVSLLLPRISVVIPCGPGHERYVTDAVDSVAAQSYPYWECIVVNDSGSDLLLPAWVREIRADVRDVGKSRNLGVAAAQAPLFLPLDADDFLQPDALQWLLSAYAESDGNTIIYPDFYEDPDTEGDFKAYPLPDWACSHLTQNGTVHAVTALTPVAFWEKVGGYDESGMGWEDWDFQLRCAEAGFCSRRLAAPLFTYRKFTGRRRDYDRATFEQRKEQILARWRDYFTGQRTFMACGCNQPTIRPAPMPAEARASLRQNGDAVLVEFAGEKAGKTRYRAPTGAIYTFAQGDTRWIAGADVSFFASRAEFRILGNQQAATEERGLSPVLSA